MIQAFSVVCCLPLNALSHHGGLYYLYLTCDTKTDACGANNVSLATSTDGVHWTERGPVILRDEGKVYVGSGSTWRNPVHVGKPCFQTNYSCHGPERHDLLRAVRRPDALDQVRASARICAGRTLVRAQRPMGLHLDARTAGRGTVRLLVLNKSGASGLSGWAEVCRKRLRKGWCCITRSTVMREGRCWTRAGRTTM